MKWLTLIAFAMTAPLQAEETPRTGGPFEVKLKSPKVTYHLYVPGDYDAGSAWPLVVALHPESTSAEDTAGWWWDMARSRGFILAAPQASGPTWKAKDKGIILAVLKDLKKKYTIDRDRMSLSGYSTSAIVATRWGMRHPELWRCIAAHAGADVKGGLRASQGKIAVILTCGEKSHAIGVMRAQFTVLQKAGVESEFTSFPDMEHDRAEPEVWEAAADFFEKCYSTPPDLLRRGERGVEDERWSDAILAYETVLAEDVDTRFELAARAGLKKLDEIGRKLITAVVEKASRDRQAALDALDELSLVFDGVPAAELALTEKARLESE